MRDNIKTQLHMHNTHQSCFPFASPLFTLTTLLLTLGGGGGPIPSPTGVAPRLGGTAVHPSSKPGDNTPVFVFVFVLYPIVGVTGTDGLRYGDGTQGVGN
jgi:hypothetical protein